MRFSTRGMTKKRVAEEDAGAKKEGKRRKKEKRVVLSFDADADEEM
jgi:hypothetical protein